MASDTDAPKGETTRVGADLIIPIASILLVIYYFTTILNSPWTAKVTAYFVGAILVACAAIYIFQGFMRLKGGATFSLMDLVEPLSIAPTRTALFVLTLGSIFVMPIIGFTLTSIVFLSAAMLLLTRGQTPILIVVLALFLSLLWFIIFVLIFQRRFPLGWLDEQIKVIVLPMLKLVGLG